MTPEQEYMMVKAMVDKFWDLDGTDESRMRAALSIAKPIIRDEALREFERNSTPQSYGPVLDGTP